ncbi:DLH domain-containing protein [Cephalotus follicularis]|uniref:DLH domain-containing protein n=1 Tax=Cephalotus follicularis TaxID=3775 RepID=A0A1Q3CES8_CEPFO|nr:DLH domain-containing protein [Cephalotus follicularis]
MSGSQCCENPPALSSSSGAGSVEEIGGLKAYVTGPSVSKRAIVLISDIFGYEAPNLRKLADKVAAAGYYVVVPDFFYGDPYVPENSDKPLPVWIKFHGTDKGSEDAKPVITALRSKCISAIGAAGFCWGAKVVVELAKSDWIQAAVLLHPSLVTVDDIKELNAPIAVLGAEVDKISPPELLKQFEEVLSFKYEINGYVKIFPGVAHGWTVRYHEEDEKAVKYAEEAHQNMLDWFIEYVK